MKNDLFVTFGDSRRGFRLAARRLVQEVQDSGWSAEVLLLNDQSARERIGKDWVDHEKWMKTTPRGHGLWVWKTIILKHALRGTFGSYRRIVYLDAGCQFSLRTNAAKTRFAEYLEIAEAGGGMAFTHRSGQFGIDDFSERVWGKKELHDAMGTSLQVLKSNQILAGCLVLTPNIVDVIDEWSEMATRDDYKFLLDPPSSKTQFPGFVAHRHDQSILSVLWKTNQLPTLPDETWFGPEWNKEASQFPIWSIRNDSSLRLPLNSVTARLKHKFEVYGSLLLDRMYA